MLFLISNPLAFVKNSLELTKANKDTKHGQLGISFIFTHVHFKTIKQRYINFR